MTPAPGDASQSSRNSLARTWVVLLIAGAPFLLALFLHFGAANSDFTWDDWATIEHCEAVFLHLFL